MQRPASKRFDDHAKRKAERLNEAGEQSTTKMTKNRQFYSKREARAAAESEMQAGDMQAHDFKMQMEYDEGYKKGARDMALDIQEKIHEHAEYIHDLHRDKTMCAPASHRIHRAYIASRMPQVRPHLRRAKP